MGFDVQRQAGFCGGFEDALDQAGSFVIVFHAPAHVQGGALVAGVRQSCRW